MKHPEIILLPIMMFADYFLTILGAMEKERKYSQHYKVQDYELNPLWQADVRKKKWFNLKHILPTLIATAAIFFAAEISDVDDFTVQAFFGFVFTFYGMVLGRHISNLLFFRRLRRKPEELSGQISLSHSLTLSLSSYQYLTAVVPIFLIAAFEPTPFVVGAAFGAAAMLLIHLLWSHLHRKAARTATQ